MFCSNFVLLFSTQVVRKGAKAVGCDRTMSPIAPPGSDGGGIGAVSAVGGMVPALLRIHRSGVLFAGSLRLSQPG